MEEFTTMAGVMDDVMVAKNDEIVQQSVLSIQNLIRSQTRIDSTLMLQALGLTEEDIASVWKEVQTTFATKLYGGKLAANNNNNTTGDDVVDAAAAIVDEDRQQDDDDDDDVTCKSPARKKRKSSEQKVLPPEEIARLGKLKKAEIITELDNAGTVHYSSRWKKQDLIDTLIEFRQSKMTFGETQQTEYGLLMSSIGNNDGHNNDSDLSGSDVEDDVEDDNRNEAQRKKKKNCSKHTDNGQQCRNKKATTAVADADDDDMPKTGAVERAKNMLNASFEATAAAATTNKPIAKHNVAATGVHQKKSPIKKPTTTASSGLIDTTTMDVDHDDDSGNKKKPSFTDNDFEDFTVLEPSKPPAELLVVAAVATNKNGGPSCSSMPSESSKVEEDVDMVDEAQSSRMATAACNKPVAKQQVVVNKSDDVGIIKPTTSPLLPVKKDSVKKAEPKKSIVLSPPQNVKKENEIVIGKKSSSSPSILSPAIPSLGNSDESMDDVEQPTTADDDESTEPANKDSAKVDPVVEESQSQYFMTPNENETESQLVGHSKYQPNLTPIQSEVKKSPTSEASARLSPVLSGVKRSPGIKLLQQRYEESTAKKQHQTPKITGDSLKPNSLFVKEDEVVAMKAKTPFQLSISRSTEKQGKPQSILSETPPDDEDKYPPVAFENKKAPTTGEGKSSAKKKLAKKQGHAKEIPSRAKHIKQPSPSSGKFVAKHKNMHTKPHHNMKDFNAARKAKFDKQLGPRRNNGKTPAGGVSSKLYASKKPLCNTKPGTVQASNQKTRLDMMRAKAGVTSAATPSKLPLASATSSKLPFNINRNSKTAQAKRAIAEKAAKAGFESPSPQKDYDDPEDNYEMSDTAEDDSDDEYNDEYKRPAKWATKAKLAKALERQYLSKKHFIDPDELFGEVETCNLEAIFGYNGGKYRKKNPRYTEDWSKDRVTDAEKAAYKVAIIHQYRGC